MDILKDYQICIPSYKRHDTVMKKTLAVLESYNVDPARIKVFVNAEEEGEYEKLKAASHSCRNLLLWPVIEFALATAMRRSEILSLEWSYINLSAGIATLPVTKNGTQRSVPLSISARNILRETSRDADHPFTTTDYAIRQGWDRLVRRAGIENLKFHDLRHEAISRFFENGLNLPEVSLISGHKDPRMLFRYTHITAEHVSRKLGSLN